MFDVVSTDRSKEKPQTQQHLCSLVHSILKDNDLCRLTEKNQSLSACSKPSASRLPEKSHLLSLIPFWGGEMACSQEDKFTCFLTFCFHRHQLRLPNVQQTSLTLISLFFSSLQIHCSHSSIQMAVKDTSVCSLSRQTCKQTDNQKLVSHSNENSRC